MQKVSVGRSMTIAGLLALIPLAGNIVASFLTTWTGSLSWAVSPIVAVLVAMVTTLVQAMGSTETERPPVGPPGQPRPVDAAPRPTTGRQRSLPTAISIIVLVIGVGGFALTFGVRYVVGYITGNESGTERLVQSATGSAEGLTVEVDSVVETGHFTRLEVAARNNSGISLTLPLFKNCLLVGADGTTLEADAFRSRWSETVAPGGLQRGTITFPGHIPARVRQARLGFTTVFGMGFDGPDSIFVESIRLK